MFMTGVLCTVCGAQVYFEIFSGINFIISLLQIKFWCDTFGKKKILKITSYEFNQNGAS